MTPSKNHSLKESFRHAAEGFVFAVRNERNMKIHCAMTALVVVCAFIFGLSAQEKAIVFTLCGIVIMAELFNTAVENAVDIAAPTFNILAKQAKDAAAAAVLIISVTAAVVGIIIFLPYAADIVRKIQHII